MSDTLARQRQIIGTSADWAAHNIPLGDGELALERAADGSVRARVGNGTSPFSASPYLGPATAPALVYIGNADVTAAPPAALAGQFVTAEADGTVAVSWGAPAAGQAVTAGTILAKDIADRWNVQGLVIDPGDFVTLADMVAPDGGGLVGFSHASTYPPGTLGANARGWVNATAAPFGATGDGVTDDAPAIQAALDFVGSLGGSGTVYLPIAPVGYRLASGLKLPSDVCLEGAAPANYQYASGNPGTSRLIADFADPMQWIVEPKTTQGGVPFDHDVILDTSFATGDLYRGLPRNLPDGVTFNCALRNLIITSTGAKPYGGIRMHGCPGSIVEGVSVHNVGCGLLVNLCFCGRYRCHVSSAYYGVACWGESNANVFEVAAMADDGTLETVPPEYLLSFMAELDGALVPTHGLSTNAHFNRPFGILCGSAMGSTSINNRWHLTTELYSGGVFLLNAYATEIGGLYIEGTDMDFGIVMARSRLSCAAFHAYMRAAAVAFDFGVETQADIRPNGIIVAGSFVGPPDVVSSLVTLRGVKPGYLGHANAPHIHYPDNDGDWIAPALNPPATNLGGANEDFAYRINRANQVELKGFANNLPAKPFTVFTLPPGFRPAKVWYFPAVGGEWGIAPDGSVQATSGGANIGTFGISFPQSL